MLATILLVIAFVLFLAAAFRPAIAPNVQLVPLGLAFGVAALLVPLID